MRSWVAPESYPFLKPHSLTASTNQQLNTSVGQPFFYIFIFLWEWMGKATHAFLSIYQLWSGDELTLVADKLLFGERKGPSPVS